MLPKSLHIEAITQFHDKLKEVTDELNDIIKVEACNENQVLRDKAYKLALRHFNLQEIWTKIDDLCEFEIKHNITLMENDDDDI